MSIFDNDLNQQTTSVAGHFSGIGSGTAVSKWFGGVIVPIGMLIYAYDCFATKQATMYGSRSSMELTGKEAVLFAGCTLSLAVFLHFHYFWPALKRLWVFTDVGKSIGALGFVICLGWMLWSILQSWV